MFVYLLCFLLIVGIPLIKNKGYFLATLLFLALVMGLRDMIGSGDIYYYAYFFEGLNFNQLIHLDFYEPGFKAYTLLIKVINTNRYFYFFVTAFVLLFLQMYSCYRISKEKGFYLITFFVLCKFYLFDFVYLRQMMAMAMVWLAFSFYYEKNNRWQGFLWFVVAALFHRSALIMLPIFFVWKIKIKWKYVVVVYAMAIVLVVSGVLFFLQNKIFLNIGEYFPYLDRLKYYAIEDKGLKLLYLTEIPFVLLILFFVKCLNLSEHKKKLLYNSVFFYGFFAIFSVMNSTFIRLSWFFFIGLVVSIGLIYYELIKPKLKPYLFSFVMLYYSAIFLRVLLLYDGGDFMPYKSIFDTFERHGKFEYYEYRKEISK